MYPIVLNILIYVFYVCLRYPLSLFIYLFIYLKHIFILILRAFMYRIVLNILIHIHMFIKKTTYIYQIKCTILCIFIYDLYSSIYAYVYVYLFSIYTI